MSSGQIVLLTPKINVFLFPSQQLYTHVSASTCLCLCLCLCVSVSVSVCVCDVSVVSSPVLGGYEKYVFGFVFSHISTES